MAAGRNQRRFGGRGTNQYAVQPMSATTAEQEHQDVERIRSAKEMYATPATGSSGDAHPQDERLAQIAQDRRKAIKARRNPDEEVDTSYVDRSYPMTYSQSLRMDDGDSPIYDDATGEHHLEHGELSEVMYDELDDSTDDKEDLAESCDYDAAVVTSRRGDSGMGPRFALMDRINAKRTESRVNSFAF